MASSVKRLLKEHTCSKECSNIVNATSDARKCSSQSFLEVFPSEGPLKKKNVLLCEVVVCTGCVSSQPAVENEHALPGTFSHQEVLCRCALTGIGVGYGASLWEMFPECLAWPDKFPVVHIRQLQILFEIETNPNPEGGSKFCLLLEFQIIQVKTWTPLTDSVRCGMRALKHSGAYSFLIEPVHEQVWSLSM